VVVTPQVWFAPAVTDVNNRPPSTALGLPYPRVYRFPASPDAFVPQQYIAPEVAIAQV
jgi:hypothetical protein